MQYLLFQSLTLATRLFLMYIPLPSPAHMEVLIPRPRTSTLRRRSGHHVFIAGLAGRVCGVGVGGVDIACAAALESM